MGDALAWVPWWLLVAVVVAVAWTVLSVVLGVLWSLAATVAKRIARRRWVRSQHPSITAALRDLGQTPEGRAYAEQVLADVRCGRHRRRPVGRLL